MKARTAKARSLLLGLLLAVWGPAAGAAVPYPECALPACDPACAIGDPACTGPDDYADYLFLAPGVLPDDLRFDPADPTRGDDWLYFGRVGSGPAAGVTVGMNVVGAWTLSTGRPDVVGAVLDSGIRWRQRDLARKVALNVAELPLPAGCPAHRDCNADGVVNVDDFAGAACPGGPVADANANGFLDGQDLILLCSDGVDDDANGYVDDIAGWDFQHDDNDPEDDTDYGHGTGEAGDQVHEADNGGSQAGVAPASMFLPLKVADSFVGVDTDFATALVYAVDRGVDYASEALGTVSQGPTGQAAIDYAYRRGVPVIASAADEQSRHHNYPAAYAHTIWVNSITTADGDFIAEGSPPDFTLQNGCTNHGGRAWVAISSNACSSEATSRAGGLTSLLIAHGKSQIERGELSPYPGFGAGLDAPYSAEEVRQIFRLAAEDVDQSADRTLSFTSTAQLLVNLALSAVGFEFTASHFETQAGWDQYTGYGRPDAEAMLRVTQDRIPPEADLTGSLRWFDTLDPARTPSVAVTGSAAARRAPGAFDWTLEIGCGVQPLAFDALDSGSSSEPLEGAVLHDWSPGATAAACGFDPEEPLEDPDGHTVTLRLRVTDSRGNVGEDRRTVAIHSDPSLAFAPLDLGASGEGAPTLADVDGDGVLDVVVGTTAGEIHVLDGRDGASLPGFPAFTDEIPVHPSPAWASGEVPVPRESVLAATAVDDLDGDGVPEIVATTLEGGVYVFDATGGLRAGFPVRTDPARSSRAVIDRFNDADPGIAAAPTLADLDPGAPGTDLEIVVAALDGHVYAWRHDGSALTGFPVKLADPAEVAIDPATGKLTPAPGGNAQTRLAKIIGSPAVGDLDGDGSLEIVAATNEEYRGSAGFDAPSRTFSLLLSIVENTGDFDALDLDVSGRVYALNHDGSPVTSAHGEPAAWPARVPMLISQLLPTVGTGTPGTPALADVDGDGRLAVAIFASTGPAMLFDGSGASRFPDLGGRLQPLAIDFPGGPPGQTGFPEVPATAGSADAPFFPGLGSGAFGDLDGDQLPEYVAPTAGLRVLLDALLPGSQEFSDHQIAAWDPRSGGVLPAFPRVMDDLQFLGGPSLADVSGDGRADVVNGSGVYLVRAYTAEGSTPAGFPKFTHGWVLASPAVGDVDGDGRSEVVAITREGNLYVWNTPGVADEPAIAWQGFARDRRNSGNLESGVAVTGAVRGDLDADRDVDTGDRDALLAAFGVREGEPGFLTAADLDRDGRITFVDYQRWIEAFRFYLDAQPPAPLCGLLGVEPLLLAALVLRRRRGRTR